MAPKAAPKGAPKAAGDASEDMRRFVGFFPYKTAWATIGNLIPLSVIIIAATYGYYIQDSSEDFTKVLEQIQEIGPVFAIAFRHREYYQGRPSTVARGVKQLYVTVEKKNQLLHAKSKYYIVIHPQESNPWVHRKPILTARDTVTDTSAELFESGLKAIAGWQTNGEFRYYISKGKKTWHDAQRFCMDRNAHLASIHTPEEQNFITSQLRDQAWIGLHDQDEEGRWRWSDDSWFTMQYWADGEPSDAESRQQVDQDCASVAPSASKYNWKDEPCEQLHLWVCKQFRGLTHRQ